MKPLTVHMIANAHIDPVWCWTWPQGADEVLATCRTACDLLDEYPALYMTRGEAWVHAQIERLDGGLFERVRAHVASGRWQCVNGWWIQPDCNLPGPGSFLKQAEIGGAYFRDRLGARVTVGYNVDSFGHTAFLPQFLSESGMDSYVFMRPGPAEMELPAPLFEWRAPGGESVTAFRIVGAYTCRGTGNLETLIGRAVADADRDIGHTMCFFGAGDHGGGPTREQVEWITGHADYAPGVRLLLSHPRAFFDEVAAARAAGAGIPEVTGELQYHSVGCYSALHRVKQQMRRAEEMALQAGRALEAAGGDLSADGAARLREAWERILFNQFHDILAGTSIREAYDHCRDELGLAKAVARDIIVGATRRAAAELPACRRQRILLTNLSDGPVDGCVEFSPWVGYLSWSPEDMRRMPAVFLDEEGKAVPCQRLLHESAVPGRLRVLARLAVPAAGSRVLEVERREPPEPPDRPAGPKLDGETISNPEVSVGLGPTGIGSVDSGGERLSAGGIRVVAIEDPTDTWSHGVDRFDGPELGVFEADSPWHALEEGPLRAAVTNTLRLGDSSLEWQVFLDGDPVVRMRLRLNWHGAERAVKLVVPTGLEGAERTDGVPGGRVSRPLDGREWPVRDFVELSCEGRSAALVTADAWGADVSADGTVRLTLLRSPYYAYHEPFGLRGLPPGAFPVTDQGLHEYEIAFVPMGEVSWDAVEAEARRQTHPIHMAETTRGMTADGRVG